MNQQFFLNHIKKSILKIFFIILSSHLSPLTAITPTYNTISENDKKKNNTIVIEIIIPGSCLYGPFSQMQYTEETLWSNQNLNGIHKNESRKLKIDITIPGLSEIIINPHSNNYFHLTINKEKENQSDCKFFIFNWPGLRNMDHFFSAAKVLYESIKTIKDHLAPHYKNININIIGYSHGGNIAALIPHFVDDDSFFIHSLFLLGTPIGSQTLQHINMKNKKNEFIIKKIINLYNPDDWVQTCDILFDFFCSKIIEPIERKNIINKIVIKNSETNKIIKKMFKYGYSIHMYYLEEDFLCNEFFKIKYKL
jgi:hypothetical protein